MNAALKILVHGAILAVGVFVYSALAIGAFQHFLHAAAVVWLLVSIGLGLFFRQRFWPQFSTAIAVIGVGLFIFFLISCGLAATSSSNPGLGDWISAAFEMIMAVYVPWFWFPFAVGAALGGIRWKQGKPENGGH